MREQQHQKHSLGRERGDKEEEVDMDHVVLLLKDLECLCPQQVGGSRVSPVSHPVLLRL